MSKFVMLLCLLLSVPDIAYAQPYYGKLAAGYEQFNNSSNISGNAITLEMKALDPTFGVNGGLRFEQVRFPGYAPYTATYLFVGLEHLSVIPRTWLYTELGFNNDEFWSYWPVVYPDYYLLIGARYKLQYLNVSLFIRTTRIIDGVGIPSGYFQSAGINVGGEL